MKKILIFVALLLLSMILCAGAIVFLINRDSKFEPSDVTCSSTVRDGDKLYVTFSVTKNGYYYTRCKYKEKDNDIYLYLYGSLTKDDDVSVSQDGKYCVTVPVTDGTGKVYISKGEDKKQIWSNKK